MHSPDRWLFHSGGRTRLPTATVLPEGPPLNFAPHAGVARDVHDPTSDFVYAVSLLAALEGATGQDGYEEILPFLGMARAELVDFGQRRPSHYVDVEIDDFHDGLAELDERLAAMLAASEDLEHSLRLDAARGLLRRGIVAAQ